MCQQHVGSGLHNTALPLRLSLSILHFATWTSCTYSQAAQRPFAEDRPIPLLTALELATAFDLISEVYGRLSKLWYLFGPPKY